MKIDFHTHVYPDRVALKTVSSVRERAGIDAYTDGTLEGLKRSMASAGIDLSVVAAVATKPEQVESIQRWLTAIRQPGIEALAAMHPAEPLSSEQMKMLRSEGFRGFKFHPDYQDFFADDPRMYPLYERVAAEGMFILFHGGMDRGLPHPVHATPKRLAAVHKVVPELCMIVAHLGGEEAYEETAVHLLGRNLYLDTSFVLRKMPVTFRERFLKEHPAERLVFASDSPWTDQREELQFLLQLPFLTESDKEKICFSNAARLLGLETPCRICEQIIASSCNSAPDAPNRV
ncbi:amidohydrolase family protein [Syntrophorhabdus aromaticivorans]|uniref:Amidohydrolase family protein n=1 Tax=Syntrophorhabdus aromaticivorans TaxID=328301 RepID=A0A971M563_9BACT|nr:amidohydrolase family protein [Syntrophorhabdus aromaticivorans]NLW36238.1 amidohydrolase family protein [Syntrophorhabdus aromaticivorans]